MALAFSLYERTLSSDPYFERPAQQKEWGSESAWPPEQFDPAVPACVDLAARSMDVV